jgi:N-acetylglucosamine-6-phosphate deacetylase
MIDGLGEGVSGFTHLFNAMTQLNSRAPGAVGAALESASSWCGIIVDRFHVHPAALRVALKAKGPDKLVLVTDAMPSVGSDLTSFMLGDRLIQVEQGRVTGDGGTLAGSNLDMASAVRNAADVLRMDQATAIAMATRNPARAIGVDNITGSIAPRLRADLALLDSSGRVLRTWIGGAED